MNTPSRCTVARSFFVALFLFLFVAGHAIAQGPTITAQPVGSTLLVGSSVTFSVTATGTPAPSYQWRRNTVAISGATNALLPFAVVSAADAGLYDVVVSNSGGSVTSTPVTLAVGAVLTNPLGTQGTSLWSVSANQYVATRFTVTAATKLAALIGDFSNGSGTLFAAIVPLASLTAIPVGATTVDTPFNAGEVLASTVFTLPSSFSGRVTVPLSVDLAPGVYGVVFGSGYLGATGSGSMVAYGSTAGSNGFYRNGPSGGPYVWHDTSSSRWSIGMATVTGAAPAPSVLVPPAARALAAGGKAALSVVPAGATPFTFQWLKDGAPIAGATQSSLLLSSFSAATAGLYSVTITNSVGSVISPEAAVTLGNIPSPAVTLVTPSGGPNILVNTAQSFSAVAIPENGRTITFVTYYANGSIIGSPINTAPYLVNWTPSAAGSYTITAVVSDNAGVFTTSLPYTVQVSNSAPPSVALTAPSPAFFLAVGSPITIAANASAVGGATISSVQFFANNQFVASATNSPFVVAWTPSVLGNATLTALATDSLGASAISGPVTVTAVAPVAFISTNNAAFSVGTANSHTFSVSAGSTPTFTVVAGTLPAWATLNATTGVLSGVPPNATGSPFLFTVQVVTSSGLLATQAFTLTVNGPSLPPVVTVFPSSRQVVNLGANLTLAATVTGATSLLWKRNGLPVSGATAATYSTTNATPARDNGWYQLVATNAAGTTTSPVIFVNVAVSPAQVAGFGNNGNGQSLPPAGLTSVTSLAAASYHSLALRSDGTVVGWGSNFFGETSIPPGLGGVVALASGGSYYSVALKSDGTVVGWGNNADAQAAAPAGLGGVVALAVGYVHTLAVKADGTVVAWGGNFTGAASVPAGLTNVVAVAGGNGHSLALKSDGTVVGWGSNGSGQITIPSGLSGVIAIAAGSNHSLALKSDGTVVAWGNNSSGQTTLPSGLSGVVAISAGDFHSLALKSDGTPVAWGYNFYGQSTFSPGLANVTGLAAGSMHTLVMRSAAADTVVPAIATHPLSQTAYLTGTVTFSITLAANPAAASLQWRKNGVPIFGAQGSSYTLFSLGAADAANYDVVVTNGVASVTSNPATLTVVTPPAPVITTQPANGVLNAGNVGSFRVSVTSPVFVTYQWRKNNTPLSGKNDSVLVLGAVQLSDAGSYDVIATNAGGSVTSTAASLVVYPATAPAFSTQPVGGILEVGNHASFSAAVTGAVPISFQWRKNGTPIVGANTLSLSLPNAQLADAGVYDLVATNGLGATTSAPATLLFTSQLTPPTITQPPISQTALVGVTASFSVVAGGVPAPTFQWRRNGLPLAGATAATLTLGLVQETDAAAYDVVVTNLQGSVISAPATLTVRGRPVIWTARLALGSGDAVGTFTLEGTAAKRLLVRAVGPALTTFSVSDPLTDPKLEIFDTAGQLVASNDDWNTHADQPGLIAATAAAGAFALPTGSKDAVVLRTYAPATYHVRVTSATGGGRIVLVELYDAEPASASRVPYTAVRGTASSAGGEIVIGGLGANGTSERTYLLRAAGPALGTSGTLANPTFTVLRDSVVRAGNDDWQSGADTTGVAAAAARVGAFSFADGSRDSALLVTANVRSGLYVGQIAGTPGNSGLVLAEAIEADAARPATFAPALVSPPSSRTVPAGVNVTLEARAAGTEPITYQWRRDAVNLSGATLRSLSLPNVVPAQAGTYTVVATNAYGTATSLPALLTVDATAPVATATHIVAPPGGYLAGGTVTVNSTLAYPGSVSALGWTVTLPPGWVYLAGSGAEGDVKPAAGATGTLEWSWSAPPASPVSFSYTLGVPAGETSVRSLGAVALVRTPSAVQTVTATPTPLLLTLVAPFHSADTSQNFSISLFELTRVIELYNTRNGTTRTGCYAVSTSATSEDGFATDIARLGTAVVTLARYHSADTTRDGKLSLTELTRVIELYNTRSGTTRTGAYHAQAGTEDGFAPGP